MNMDLNRCKHKRSGLTTVSATVRIGEFSSVNPLAAKLVFIILRNKD